MFRLVKGWLVYVPLAAQEYPFETDLLRHLEWVANVRRTVLRELRSERPTPKGATFPALYAQDAGHVAVHHEDHELHRFEDEGGLCAA